MVDIGNTLTAPAQRGSVLATGGKIVKIIFWLVLILVVVLIFALASKLADYGATLDPSTWDDAAQAWAEESWGVDDTTEGGGSAFLSGVWWASGGALGGLFGLGTTSSGFKGIGEAYGNSRNGYYTWFLRTIGR